MANLNLTKGYFVSKVFPICMSLVLIRIRSILCNADPGMDHDPGLEIAFVNGEGKFVNKF